MLQVEAIVVILKIKNLLYYELFCIVNSSSNREAIPLIDSIMLHDRCTQFNDAEDFGWDEVYECKKIVEVTIYEKI